MRRNSNLPSLQLHQSSSTKNHNVPSKDNVKIIETKINRHESQIQRNQKVIISLTNQFRLIKEELKTQQKQNQQLSEMFRRVSDENQKLIKTNKQFRNLIVKLEKNIQDHKDKLANTSKNKDQGHVQQLRIMQEEIKIYKEQFTSKKKQAKILQVANQEAMKENQMLRSRVNDLIEHEKGLQKVSDRQKQEIHNYYRNSAVQLKNKIGEQKQIIRQLEQQNEKYNQVLRDRDHKSRQLSKSQTSLKQFKEKFNLKSQQLKFSTERVIELEGLLKRSAKSSDDHSQLLKKVQDLQASQAEYKLKITDITSKFDNLQKLYSQQIKQLQESKKKLRPLNKILKNKSTLQRVSSKVKQSIICQYCNKLLIKPVTNIPCGHSYCFDCKKGYERECKKCTNVKREAVYRNQLMDEIIQSYKAMKDIIETLQTLQ